RGHGAEESEGRAVRGPRRPDRGDPPCPLRDLCALCGQSSESSLYCPPATRRLKRSPKTELEVFRELPPVRRVGDRPEVASLGTRSAALDVSPVYAITEAIGFFLSIDLQFEDSWSILAVWAQGPVAADHLGR